MTLNSNSQTLNPNSNDNFSENTILLIWFITKQIVTSILYIKLQIIHIYIPSGGSHHGIEDGAQCLTSYFRMWVSLWRLNTLCGLNIEHAYRHNFSGKEFVSSFIKKTATSKQSTNFVHHRFFWHIIDLFDATLWSLW